MFRKSSAHCNGYSFVYRYELDFLRHVWLVSNASINRIADYVLKHLEVSGNVPHRSYSIYIVNVLHTMYEFCYPITVQTLRIVFTLRYRRHILVGDFKFFTNFVHRKHGNLQKTCNIAVLCLYPEVSAYSTASGGS